MTVRDADVPKKRNAARPTGAPDWIVTFADLMSILVCFFVLIISFSIQDQQKLQVVAGSMREAFGVEPSARRAGVIEVDGVPVRQFIREKAIFDNDNETEFSSERHEEARAQGPEANTNQIERADIERPRHFATAAATLRQALEELPEIAELSRQIVIEESEEGLDISLVDEEGRSMFPEGSKYPYERTRQLLVRIAPVLMQMPNRLTVTGHTASDADGPGLSSQAWHLSGERAHAVLDLLQEFGVPRDRFAAVVGKADSEPLFPDDPYLSANRRISILLMREDPPIPPDFRP